MTRCYTTSWDLTRCHHLGGIADPFGQTTMHLAAQRPARGAA